MNVVAVAAAAFEEAEPVLIEPLDSAFSACSSESPPDCTSPAHGDLLDSDASYSPSRHEDFKRVNREKDGLIKQLEFFKEKHSQAYSHLKKITGDKRRLKHVAQMSPHGQMFSLEAFHSILINFAPKPQACSPAGMLARSQGCNGNVNPVMSTMLPKTAAKPSDKRHSSGEVVEDATLWNTSHLCLHEAKAPSTTPFCMLLEGIISGFWLVTFEFLKTPWNTPSPLSANGAS
ncbi:hypothetical protein HPB47_023860 [Ixodes persulcatus]|uniref:Uncharacterized protein n=1 Tax=Ixodes persulcatus TaxID=34615 RepID=A0AC60Q5R6_IXOPE|nr:hypothetical protein HPB47_023860 [Ixodes persulcatus]